MANDILGRPVGYLGTHAIECRWAGGFTNHDAHHSIAIFNHHAAFLCQPS